jgi:hypothetical protein
MPRASAAPLWLMIPAACKLDYDVGKVQALNGPVRAAPLWLMIPAACKLDYDAGKVQALNGPVRARPCSAGDAVPRDLRRGASLGRTARNL